MSEQREYDPVFASGGAHTILDVARDHTARQGYCSCSICWMVRMTEKIAAELQRKAAEAELIERLMQEWP